MHIQNKGVPPLPRSVTLRLLTFQLSFDISMSDLPHIHETYDPTLLGVEFECQALETVRAVSGRVQDSFKVLKIMEYYIGVDGRPNLKSLQADINSLTLSVASAERQWLLAFFVDTCPDDALFFSQILLALVLCRRLSVDDADIEYEYANLKADLEPIAHLLECSESDLFQSLAYLAAGDGQSLRKPGDVGRYLIGFGAAVYQWLFEVITGRILLRERFCQLTLQERHRPM